MITDPLQLMTVFCGVVLLALVLVERSKVAQKLSPVLLILFMGALLSNTGIIVDDSPFYNQVTGFAVPFAVCLVLFQVRLADLKRTGPAMLVAFALASIGTVVGTVLAGLVLNTPLQAVMGSESWKLTGPYVGTYIGGSLNFFALWTGLEIGNPDLFAAANAVDNLTLIPIFLFWILVPERVTRFFPVAKTWADSEAVEAEPAGEEKPVGIKIVEMVSLSFAALVVMFVSDWIKAEFIAEFMPQFPTILLVTTFALVLAQFKFIAKLGGARELGNLSFYFFFAAVGAMINVMKAVLLAPVLFVYVMIIIGFHVVFLLAIGRLFRIDIRTLAIGSVAAKCGPPTVLALTNVMGWRKLVLPGVAAALLGYAIGNYIGFGAAYLVKFLLGQ